MQRLILLASLAVLLLQEVHGAPKYQVIMNAERKDSFSEENTNEELNLDPKAVEQSEKDKLHIKYQEELFTDWEKQDILRRFRNPIILPEEDRDFLYHPSSTEDVIEEPGMLRMPQYEVLQGPEKNMDHIYHAADY